VAGRPALVAAAQSWWPAVQPWWPLPSPGGRRPAL